jgi:hypothetical protein
VDPDIVYELTIPSNDPIGPVNRIELPELYERLAVV